MRAIRFRTARAWSWPLPKDSKMLERHIWTHIWTSTATSSSSCSIPPRLPYTEDELSLLRDGIPVRSETYFKPDGWEELKEVPKEEPEATVASEPEGTA